MIHAPLLLSSQAHLHGSLSALEGLTGASLLFPPRHAMHPRALLPSAPLPKGLRDKGNRLDIHAMFESFNELYFNSSLNGVFVEYSSKVLVGPPPLSSSWRCHRTADSFFFLHVAYFALLTFTCYVSAWRCVVDDSMCWVRAFVASNSELCDFLPFSPSVLRND